MMKGFGSFAAGLLTREKRSRWRYYEATPLATRLVGVLDESRERAPADELAPEDAGADPEGC